MDQGFTFRLPRSFPFLLNELSLLEIICDSSYQSKVLNSPALAQSHEWRSGFLLAAWF
jgi:hypothetical protein